MSIGHNRRRSLVTPPSLTPQRDVSDFVEAFKSRHLSSGSAPSTPTSRRRGSLPCAIPRKTMSWSQNLENLIEDPAGKLAFAAFLQDEFASENLNFLLAAKRFSQQVNFVEQKKSAEDVILRFIGDKSETPVNLSAEIETGIFRSFERGEIKSSLFDAAQDAIRDMLRYDSYPRFLKSTLYNEIFDSSFKNLTSIKQQETVFRILEHRRRSSNSTFCDASIRKKTKRRRSALQLIRNVTKGKESKDKCSKVARSQSLKTETHVYVQLSTGDEFTIEADGHTRTIDALLRLCFSNVPPACSVQWSLSVASIRTDVLSANWLQLSTATLAGAKVFGEVRVNLKVLFESEMIEVRAKPHKILSQVIQHVLQKLQVGLLLEQLKITDDNGKPLQTSQVVADIETNSVRISSVTRCSNSRSSEDISLAELLVSRGRIENQRGMLDKANLELPAFLRAEDDITSDIQLLSIN